MPAFRTGRLVSLRRPDDRRWVRLLALIRRRPVPLVTRDYLVTERGDGRRELTEIEFG
jgi:hypothetical protein